MLTSLRRFISRLTSEKINSHIVRQNSPLCSFRLVSVKQYVLPTLILKFIPAVRMAGEAVWSSTWIPSLRAYYHTRCLREGGDHVE